MRRYYGLSETACDEMVAPAARGNACLDRNHKAQWWRAVEVAGRAGLSRTSVIPLVVGPASARGGRRGPAYDGSENAAEIVV